MDFSYDEEPVQILDREEKILRRKWLLMVNFEDEISFKVGRVVTSQSVATVLSPLNHQTPLDFPLPPSSNRTNSTWEQKKQKTENQSKPQDPHELTHSTRACESHRLPHDHVFDGLQDEDLDAHLANFLEIYDTFMMNGWLNSLPRGSITTWAQMTEKFLLKYFPLAKTAKLRNDISSFFQFDIGTLYDT
ncbi:DNA damage-inducible protein 1-like [Gossypium australe]|uniref:DNA damage-inducible protein 1-like n=1 Tax=Gossypium australe TaxID=47621 RepID=A0A5B6VLI1_9ROSI|nr:DNA damage-inducible protein 1-like [Gossypium australe]